MAPTFSNPTKIVTITATVDTSNVRNNWGGFTVSDNDVSMAAETALRDAARSNGVTIDGLTVTVADGPRTVTLTEEEYNALRQGGNAGA
jgi:hypothetical protein